MARNSLSQMEIDALLKDGNGDTGTAAGTGSANTVRAYHIGTQERIVRGHMPTLEMINVRFARLLRLGLFDFIHRSPDIAVEPVKVIKFSEFVRNLAAPTSLNIVHLKPLRGSSLFVFDPRLVCAVIDNMFGGDSRFETRIEGREFTATEMRIIHQLLQVAFDGYQRSWAPVHALTCEHVRSESHAQFASIVMPSEIVIVTSVAIQLGGAGGKLHICIPYATVEPIRDALYSTIQGDSHEPDRRWVKMLTQQVQLADVDLVAQFARVRTTAGRVAHLKPGDVIDIDVPRTVTAEVDGVPVFECRYGTKNGRYALRIERTLTVSASQNQLGD